MFAQYQEIFACPACGNGLEWETATVRCKGCRAAYDIAPEGMPLLFCPNEGRTSAQDVTGKMKAFYEENPFPNYDDSDSRDSLVHKAVQGMFARLLNEQIPPGALVLEAGCGTGQMSNFLGLNWQRHVFGADLCLNSLRLAQGFKTKFSVNHASFLQMNLFRPPFRAEVFDVVFSNGVLHHTGDPRKGFESIARLVKPGGHIVIGLYNHIGRLPTDFRRWLFSAFGDGLSFLDDHMRNTTYNEARKRAWFMDQYKNPHESKHSYSEVLEWFEGAGFDFRSAVPKIDGSFLSAKDKLFEKHDPGSGLDRFLTECQMLLRGGQDGAIFILTGQKSPA